MENDKLVGSSRMLRLILNWAGETLVELVGYVTLGK